MLSEHLMMATDILQVFLSVSHVASNKMILHTPFFFGKTTGVAILNDLQPFFHPDYMCRLFHEKILLRYDEMIISQNSVLDTVLMVYRLPSARSRGSSSPPTS